MKSGLKELYLLLLICYALSFVSCSTLAPERSNPPPFTPAPEQTSAAPAVRDLIAPVKTESSKAKNSKTAVRGSRVLLKHTYYTIDYDSSLRLPRKVEYTLTAESLSQKVAKRKQTKFHEDPLLTDRSIASVHVAEYKGQKGKRALYDKGHMAPANDFAFSQEAMNDTFVMSNMVPQKPKLNEVAWKTLEAQVQKWACGEKRVTVITGPIIEDEMKSLDGGLAVPERFYKVVVDETPPRKVIGFIYSQEDTRPKIHAQRMVAVAQIERESREDFKDELKGLPPASLEQKGDLSDWAEANCAGRK